MEFQSGRFAGDGVLEEILNDPDSGTKKLQKGSDVGSVALVQRALWDLWWPDAAEPGIHIVDGEDFADGDYGGDTTRTVLTYKTHYGLTFPPDQPGGFVDGFAGPRTLRLLDEHIVLYDELDPLIRARVEEMTASASAFSFSSKRPNPVLGTATLTWHVEIEHLGTFFYATRGLDGSQIVVDPIATEYLGGRGGAAGPLGPPLADAVEDDEGITQQFELGVLRHDKATGQTSQIESGDPPVAGLTGGF